MGSGLLRCQPGPMSCCRVSGGSSGLKAAPRGDFRDPKVSVACLFCPRRPWHTQCRSQVRLPWALSLRASQGHSMLPSKVSDSPGLACLWNIRGASLPSAGFLQVHTGSRSSRNLLEGAALAV